MTRARLVGRASVALSAALCLATAVGYTWRLDAWAAVTVFPIWCWVLAGALLIAMARRQVNKRVSLTLAAAWCAVLVAIADHPLNLLRLGPSSGTNALRIVSLNCAGLSGAVAEVAALEPDIVLLQETPGREPVAALARELFSDEGEVLVGVDASIVARGRLTPLTLPASVRSYAVFARLRLSNGVEVKVVSLRLDPPLVRVDLWSPDCWREQAENRRRRRNQLEAILSAVQQTLPEMPVIVGGDFNAPPRDAVLASLKPALHDAFAEAGRGWGNTILNAAPFFRIDQIWLSPRFRAVDVHAQKTTNSDHRMVVCDVARLR